MYTTDARATEMSDKKSNLGPTSGHRIIRFNIHPEKLNIRRKKKHKFKSAVCEKPDIKRFQSLSGWNSELRNVYTSRFTGTQSDQQTSLILIYDSRNGGWNNK